MPGPKGTIEYLLSDEDNLRNQSAGTQGSLEQQQAQAQSQENSGTGNEDQMPRFDTMQAYIDAQKQVEKEAEERNQNIAEKRKKELRWIALNDGISALSNLLFTSLGAPNAYDPKNNMSDRFKARYDELYKANDDADKQKVNDLYSTYVSNYQQELEAWRQRKADKAQRQQAERWEREFDYRQQKDKAERELNERIQAERERHNNAMERVNTIKANVSSLSRSGYGPKGKSQYTNLVDPDNNVVSIGNFIWADGNAMQLLFNTLIEEGVGRGENEGDAMYKRRMKDINTKEKIAEFVKQNWYKGKETRDMALMLSQIDPSNPNNNAGSEDGGLHWGEKSEEKKEDNRPVIIWHE